MMLFAMSGEPENETKAAENTSSVEPELTEEAEKNGFVLLESKSNLKKGDKVYTASQDKAQKLEANTPEIPAKSSPFNSENDAKKEGTETSDAAQAPEVKAESAEETKAPKKRGRKPKAQKSPEQAPQEQTEVKMEETATVGNVEQTNEMISIPEENNDFIAIHIEQGKDSKGEKA